MAENNILNQSIQDIDDREAFFNIDEAIKTIMNSPHYNEQSKQAIDTLVHAKELVTVKRRAEAVRMLEEIRDNSDRLFDKDIASYVSFRVGEALLNL